MAGKGHVGIAPFGDLLQKYLDGHAMGNVRFVGAGGTDDDDHGRTPESPYLTIQHAIDSMVAANDDLILVGPGHTTTLTAAGTVTADVAGLTIRGYGWPLPVLNYTTNAAASLNVTAANVRVERFRFTMTGVASVTAGINISAAGCIIRDCQFEQGDGTNCAVLGILTTAAANRLLVERCHFYTGSVAATTAIRLVGGSDIVIQDNVFQGAYDTGIGAIQNVTTAGERFVVRRNVIQNFTASNTKAMVFHASSTGQITNNSMQILSGTAPITGAAMSRSGPNYYTAAVDTNSSQV